MTNAPNALSIEPPLDHLDFERAVHAYLATSRLVALLAVRTGIRHFGPDNQTVVQLDTPRGIQSLAWLNLKAGPVVVEIPQSSVAVIHDFWGRPISGSDSSTRGGPLLALPPDFRGDVPRGYFAVRSRTFGNRLLIPPRLTLLDATESTLDLPPTPRIYPLADALRQIPTSVVKTSGLPALPVQGTGLSHFADVDRVIQEELHDALDIDTVAILASIGIRKGVEFAPNDRLRRILAASAVVGNDAERLPYVRTPDLQ